MSRHSNARHWSGFVAVCTLVAMLSAPHAQTLRIGLGEDPDVLDPTLGRTFVGRVVFAALCDRLFDVDEHLAIVPYLAQSYEWSADAKSLTIRIRDGVTFHDGDTLDAAAVKFSLDRHKSLPGSNRRTELAVVQSVDVIDPLTVRVNLSLPYSPLLSVLADSAGIIVSPRAALASRDRFGANPVCSGPFRFGERVAQDRIVLERFERYWNPGTIHFQRVVYLPIPDATVRLANLRSGQLDMITALEGHDLPSLENDKRFRIARVAGLGYSGITINVGKSERAKATALGRDPRVREAFELSLDRDAIVQVARDGEAATGNQWQAPSSKWYARNAPIPRRDVARARALLKEAGIPVPQVTLMTPAATAAQRVAEVIQAMVREAGFDLRIQSTEFATSLDMADKGNFDAYLIGWSGRIDPDLNVFRFNVCNEPQNSSGYCNPDIDDLLTKARSIQDVSRRRSLYEHAAVILLTDRPIIYLYHGNLLWAYVSKLSGLRPIPDGLIRMQGITF